MITDDMTVSPKDTSKSCIFDYPDRPDRPTPPVDSEGHPIPDYPYNPTDDWPNHPDPIPVIPPEAEIDDDGHLNTGSIHQFYFSMDVNIISLPAFFSVPIQVVMYRSTGAEPYIGYRVKTITLDHAAVLALPVDTFGLSMVDFTYRSTTSTGNEWFWLARLSGGGFFTYQEIHGSNGAVTPTGGAVFEVDEVNILRPGGTMLASRIQVNNAANTVCGTPSLGWHIAL